MKKIIIKSLAFLPLLFIVVGINYFIDPENFFQSYKFEKGIAEYSLQHKYVTDIYNYSERKYLKYFITGLKTCPTTAIIGASRELTLDSTFFTGDYGSLLNFSMKGATLEDEMAIYGIMESYGFQPKEIILGIEPYFFNSGYNRNTYGPIREYYYAVCNQIGMPASKKHERFFKYGHYMQLFSLEYFQKSILFWVGTGNNHNYVATSNMFNKNETKCPNGALVYSESERNISQAETDALAEKVAYDNTFYIAENYKALSTEMMLRFEKFVEFLQKKGIKIDIVLAPFHPIVYKAIKKMPKYKMVIAADQYVIAFANRKGITLFGSLDPAVYGIDNTGFYDEEHLKKWALQKILAEPLKEKMKLK